MAGPTKNVRPTGTDPGLEALLSPEQVARACGLSRRAVYRAIARGELPAARLCHRLRISPADLKRWISEQRLVASVADGAAIRPAQPTPRGSLRAMLDDRFRDRGDAA